MDVELQYPIGLLKQLTDRETVAHSVRVATLSTKIGQALDFTAAALQSLQLGGLLHDIGKGFITAEILSKPGRLTAEERRTVQEHPLIGTKLLAAIMPELAPEVVDIVLHHHERLDGSGYPHGLHWRIISPMARIVGIADVYDALVHDRPYRAALSKAQALTILEQEAAQGKLDAAIVALLPSLVGPVAYAN